VVTDPKIAALRELTRTLLVDRIPVLSVCLGHQVLAAVLGLPLRRRPVPAQGEQREIDFFGRAERVGFYNTFAAYADTDRWSCPLVDGPVEVCRNGASGEVYALRAPGIRSVQFHPESVLTRSGPAIIRDLMVPVLRVPASSAARSAGTGP
jgi:phenazine biosynthesis protein phzE